MSESVFDPDGLSKIRRVIGSASARRLVLILLLVMTLAWLRLHPLQFKIWHPDEIIPVEVIKGMRERNDLNSNWALAALPDYFRYDQFNFSSYILSGRIWSDVFARLGSCSGDTVCQLRLFSAWCSVATAGLVALFSYRHFGPWAAGAALALFAFTPLGVQDAMYARPEAFLALAATAMAVLSVQCERSFKLMACLIGGIMVACKFSCIVLLIAPAAAILIYETASSRDRRSVLINILEQGSLAIALAALGFVLGAPGALSDPSAYLNGVKRLSDQYTEVHAPHGVFNANPVSSAFWALRYFVETCGPFAPAVAGLGASVTLRRDPRLGVILILFLAPTLIALFPLPVFFERNYSHLLPVGCILFGAGTAYLVREAHARFNRFGATGASAGLLALSLLIPVTVSTIILSDVLPGNAKERHEASLQTYSQQLGAPIHFALIQSEGEFRATLDDLRKQTGPILLHTPYWRGGVERYWRKRLDAEPDITFAGRTPHPLDWMQASTIGVYLGSSSNVYLYSPDPAAKQSSSGERVQTNKD